MLLAKHSRPEDLMNLNIFQRKWKGGIGAEGMNELKRQMMSGAFCDPTHNDTGNGSSGKRQSMRPYPLTQSTSRSYLAAKIQVNQ